METPDDVKKPYAAQQAEQTQQLIHQTIKELNTTPNRSNWTTTFLDNELYVGYCENIYGKESLIIQSMPHSQDPETSRRMRYMCSAEFTHFFQKQVTATETRSGAFLVYPDKSVWVLDIQDRSKARILSKEDVKKNVIKTIELQPDSRSAIARHLNGTLLQINRWDNPQKQHVQTTDTYKKLRSDGSYFEEKNQTVVIKDKSNKPISPFLHFYQAARQFVHCYNSTVLCTYYSYDKDKLSFLVLLDTLSNSCSITNLTKIFNNQNLVCIKAFLLANPRYCLCDIRGFIDTRTFDTNGMIALLDIEEERVIARFPCSFQRDIAVHNDGRHIAINDRIVDISSLITD